MPGVAGVQQRSQGGRTNRLVTENKPIIQGWVILSPLLSAVYAKLSAGSVGGRETRCRRCARSDNAGERAMPTSSIIFVLHRTALSFPEIYGPEISSDDRVFGRLR